MPAKKKKITKLDSNYMQQYDAYIERQRRKKKRLIRRLILFSIVVLLTVGSMTLYHVKQRTLYSEKSDQYEKVQDKLASLKKEEEELREEIDLLKNDDYVMEIARTNYFFSKEGEMIFQIPDNKSPSY